jgi:hypothetical protein
MRTLQQQWNDTLAMFDGIVEGFSLDGELKGSESSHGWAAPSPLEEEEMVAETNISAWFSSGEGICDTSEFHVETLPERLDEERNTQLKWNSRMYAIAASAKGHEHYLYLWQRKQERLERFELLKAWAQGKAKSSIQRMLDGAWARYRVSVQRDYDVYAVIGDKKRRVVHKVDNSGIYLTRAQLSELAQLG